MSDRPIRVLVVDDDPDVLRAFMRLLSDHADVKVALGAEPALRLLASQPFHTVVCDFAMAGPHGAWLLRQVRDKYPETKRVLVSGRSYSELARYLEPDLVDRFLEKPLDDDELLDTVQALQTG